MRVRAAPPIYDKFVWRTLISFIKFIGLLGILLVMASCGEQATLSVDAGTGANPQLPEPKRTLIPTVQVAEVKGWGDAMPTPAAGLKVTKFADGLDHPRWIYVTPSGDVLVAETNAPPRPEENKGIRAWFMKMFMKKAGAATPSANRITLLRDTNGDGMADVREILLKDLNSPFGMAADGQDLYVATTDAILRFPYTDGQTVIAAPGVKLADLPAGPRNHHWTKNIILNSAGDKIYATVGSNSNIAEHGMDEEKGRAAIWQFDKNTGQGGLYATGLRNPNGLAWEPVTGELWTTVNERDEIGSDLVPDYMTSVREGAFYGWPYSYYGQTVDTRVKPQQPDLVARAVKPDYALGPHTAALGLAFSRPGLLPPAFSSGAFVGLHGSWNRKPPSGYKVVFIPFTDGKPAGPPVDVLTGFLDADGAARGRPVGVALDAQGALLVADDAGNHIWRVTAAD
jgi:glucose/arabinose dehydrogenase